LEIYFMTEFKTLQFPNTASGQADKVRALQLHTSQGWRVVSETIVAGKFRTKTACCFFLIFAPCAFLAGHDDDIITVTLQRDEKPAKEIDAAPAQLSFDKSKWTALIEYDPEIASAVAPLRGFESKWLDEAGAAYLTLNDPKYLPEIVSKLVARAEVEQQEREQAQRAAKERREVQLEQERQRMELRKQRLAATAGFFWGDPTRRTVTVVVAVLLAIVLFAILSRPKSASEPNAARPVAQQQPEAIKPSFDCVKIQSHVLKLVCSTPELAELDVEMAAEYQLALGRASNTASLKQSQRAWIRKRNNSNADIVGLHTAYRERINFIKQWTAPESASADTSGVVPSEQALPNAQDVDPQALAAEDAKIATDFYTALSQGDGNRAAELVIQSKRYSGPLSANDLTRYYSSLPEKLQLLSVYNNSDGTVQVRYLYKKSDGEACNASSTLYFSGTIGNRLIDRIRTPSGC
jgi:uncharacterized protein